MNMGMRGSVNMPPVVKNLLIVNVIVFLAQTILPLPLREGLLEYGALHFWKYEHFFPYQIVTSMFMHADISHLFCNMFALWMFGRIVEYDLGSRRFLLYYLVCGMGAGLIQLGVQSVEWSVLAAQGVVPQSLSMMRVLYSTTIGASGAVFGILLAYGMIHPNNVIMLMFPPIALKAKWFVVIYGAVELVAGVAGTGGTVAHFAHLGGMLFGWLLLRYWKKKREIFY